jgi:acetyl-CoA acetyltransferase
MTDIAIVGVGETAPHRAEQRPLLAMIEEAVRSALADAGLPASAVDGFVSESASMPAAAPAEAIAARLGRPVNEKPFIAYGAKYGAGLVAAPQLAAFALRAGLASVVVCWYGHKLSQMSEGPRTIYAEDPLKADLELPQGWFGQPVYFAAIAQRYAHEYGLTEAQLAATAIEAREHAAHTPGALRANAPLDFTGYLASPMVSSPLRGADCCLVNDGAVAYVMTTMERARDLRHKPIVVAGVGTGTAPVIGDTWFTQRPDFLSTPATISGPRAFADAGLRPNDIDFVELYDCFTINNILQFEELGFAPRGQGAAFALDKGRALTDRLPTNTHGGLLANSFTLAAGHVVEAVRQLRHERGMGQVPNAQVGLVTGLGVPHHSTLILRRGD